MQVSAKVIYVYAIGRQPGFAVPPNIDAVDGISSFEIASGSGLDALYSEVDADMFSQEEIDRRSQDLNWLGSIGYRHERAVAALAERTTIVPLRAFTLFSTRGKLEEFLKTNVDSLSAVLGKLEGREEWTIRIELDAAVWEKAIVLRVDSLRALSEQISHTSPGKAYLLTKKLEDGKKSAAREAELELVSEIEGEIRKVLEAPMVSEGRQKKAGSFPQINILLPRERSGDLDKLHRELTARYREEGVNLVLTGPWPPYTFASGASDG